MQPIFNVRVYGLLINDKNEILVTEQVYKNTFLRKFPGGGLVYGEGLIDCLKREFMEELGIEITIVQHFYTTDFFVPSNFHENNQVIAVYYLIQSAKEIIPAEEVSDETKEKFRWMDLDALTDDDLTLPIDKHVLQLMRQGNLKI